jgi:hypothetical protein
MSSQPPRRASGEAATSSSATASSAQTSQSTPELVLDEDTLCGVRELEREIAGANAAFAGDAWRDSAQFPVKSVFVFNAVRKIRTVKPALPPVADLPPTVQQTALLLEIVFLNGFFFFFFFFFFFQRRM